MAADFRHPREDQVLQNEGSEGAEGMAASELGGETLAEKIRRYRRPDPRAAERLPAPGGWCGRNPREV